MSCAGRTAVGRARCWSGTSALGGTTVPSHVPGRCRGEIGLRRQRRCAWRELWRSDGTPAGTMLVKDINAQPGLTILRRPPRRDGEDEPDLWMVNTVFSCLAGLDPRY